METEGQDSKLTKHLNDHLPSTHKRKITQQENSEEKGFYETPLLMEHLFWEAVH